MGKLVNFRQVVRYYAVGAAVNGIGYLLFLLFISIGVEHKAAASFLYIVGVLASYLLNRKFVFNRIPTARFSSIKLATMLVGGYILNISLLFFFVDILNIPSGFVQFTSVILVSIYFYLVNKFYIHRDSII